jgi:hypothetical protein
MNTADVIATARTAAHTVMVVAADWPELSIILDGRPMPVAVVYDDNGGTGLPYLWPLPVGTTDAEDEAINRAIVEAWEVRE